MDKVTKTVMNVNNYYRESNENTTGTFRERRWCFWFDLKGEKKNQQPKKVNYISNVLSLVSTKDWIAKNINNQLIVSKKILIINLVM